MTRVPIDCPFCQKEVEAKLIDRVLFSSYVSPSLECCSCKRRFIVQLIESPGISSEDMKLEAGRARKIFGRWE